jgi:hypothetical protein
MTVADIVAKLDRLEDAPYLADQWARGETRLDGWQLEYAGRCYGLKRVPGATLRKRVAYSVGTNEIAFYKGARAEERRRAIKYLFALKEAVTEDERSQ